MFRYALALPLAICAPAAGAQSLGNGYTAVPVAPAKAAKFSTRGTPWFQRGDGYVAPRAPERNQIVCAMVVKKIGKLSSFSVAGQPLPAEDLAACNAIVD